MSLLEDSIHSKVESEYDEWANEYYSADKIDELKQYVECSKEDIIEFYIKLGYTREEVEVILDETFTLEQYMDCHKRIECSEKLNNIMAVSYAEIQAVSDIIDAIYEGMYYNSKLVSTNGEKIKGTFGHGMIYYHSIDVVFQEILANYCLLLKSDKKDETFQILKNIIGNDLFNMLDKFYNVELLNSSKYENNHKSL